MMLDPRALLLALVAALSPALDTSPDPRDIRRHAEALLACGDASVGSDGAQRRADYLREQLQAAGFAQVHSRISTVAAPLVGEAGAWLTVGGRRVVIAPHMPNLNVPASTWDDTIAGELVYLGQGEELGQGDLSGRIAVLEADSGRAWSTAAELGAVAVLFIHPERLDAEHLAEQFIEASLDLPRFVCVDWHEDMAGQQGVLSAPVAWQPVKVETLLVEIPGTGPVADQPALMLSTGYDGAGNIRGLDPATHRAWNSALLLTLATQFRRAPCQRDLHIVFHAGRAQAFQGFTDLLGSLGDRRNQVADALAKAIKWPKAPLGDAEAVDLSYQIWRTDLIRKDFEAFLASPPALQTEQHLKDLLYELDNLPEDSDVFNGIDYPPKNAPAEADPASTAPSGPTVDTSIPLLSWILFGVVLAVALALLAWRLISGRLPWAALLAIWLVLGLVGKKLVTSPEVFTATDTAAEGTAVFELGLQFIAEEAARRADRLGPPLERLRLLDAILTWWTPERLASRQTDVKRQERWERELLKMRECREQLSAMLPPDDVAILRPEMALDAVDEAYRQAVRDLSWRVSVTHRGWRNIQQKLAKAALEPEELEKLPDLIAKVLHGADGPSLLQRQRHHLAELRADLLTGIALREAVHTASTGLVVDLDLSDGADRYGTISRGSLVENNDGDLHDGIARLVEDLRHRDAGLVLPFTPAPYETGYEPGAWWPVDLAHAAGFIGHFAPAVTLATVCDHRGRHGSPADTPGRFAAGRFLAQTSGMTALLAGIAEQHSIVERRQTGRPEYTTATMTVETRSEGSIDGKKGYPFPQVLVMLGDSSRLGVDFHPFSRDTRLARRSWGDAFGRSRLLWFPKNLKSAIAGQKFSTSACGFDADGRLDDVVVSDGVHKAKGVDNSGIDIKNPRDVLLQVFEAEASHLFGVFDPRLLRTLSKVHLLSAARDAKPDYLHIERDGQIAVLFSPPATRLRVLAAEGEIGNRLLLLGDHMGGGVFRGLYPGGSLSTELLAGAGPAEGLREIEIDNAGRNRVPTAMAVARDMLLLNKARLDRLQRNGINPEASWAQLAEAQQLFEESERAWVAGDATTAEARAQSSWSYLGTVYPQVLATANDVVYGLVVMLLLAIPFALICERLFLAGNTIGRKAAGFGGFFALVFLFFFFLHPAFSLATTPVIIFLAFTIILLSVMVIAILYGRFEHEMQLVRMTGLGMHTADVNRLSTLFATGQLGISNMRRRPLRTFLTATTVVLMTFILLTFANFRASADIRTISLGVPPNLEGSQVGIQIAVPGWAPFQEPAEKRIRNAWGDQLRIHTRRWLQSSDRQAYFPIIGPAAAAQVEGVIGSSARDPSGLDGALVRGPIGSDLRGWDPIDPASWLFLPPEVVELAGLVPGGPVLFQGIELKVGLLDIPRLAGVSHLGGDPITPLSLASMSPEQKEEMKRQQAAVESGEGGGDTGSFTHIGPEQCAVAHSDLIERLGGEIRSFTLVPYDSAEARTLAERLGREVPDADSIDIDAIVADMAHQLATGIILGARGDCALVSSVSGVSLSGLGDVLIPLILGGLIIFSTMLGSVAERGKEIFIFSSLGLAPIHIGALFLVEAAIYAILGGLGGYILAQLLVAGLGFFADLGIGVQPDLNYSSFTAVATILLVMATVLLSALYPALIASRSARPGDEADFSVPEPEGDKLEIPFPFTVSRRDICGLLAFLRTYFEANTEASVGCFTAADARMEIDRDSHVYQVSATTWLAPFDLGISQSFVMTSRPTDLPAIYSVHISLALLSGQRNAWRRVVLPFLKELRKQFLVWRTLDAATMERYRIDGGDQEAIARAAAAKEAAAKEAAAVAEAAQEAAAIERTAKAEKAEKQAEQAGGTSEETGDDEPPAVGDAR